VSTGKKVDTYIMYTEIHGHIVTDDPLPRNDNRIKANITLTSHVA